MALSQALFAGLSGLNVNQVKLNVVGNNIANVNTIAFKSSRVLFKPQFYLTDANGTQPSGELGGTNPSQRGLGAVVATVDRNMGGGSIEPTGRPTDLALEGDGFFIVRGEETMYTRDGSFRTDAQNRLVTTSGDFVQGFAVDQDFNLVPGQLANITIPLNAMIPAQATTAATVRGNLKSSGIVASGASIWSSGPFTTNAGTPPGAATLLTDLDLTSPFAVGDVFDLNAQKGTSAIESSFTVAATSTLGDLVTFFQNALGINTSVPDDGNPATPTAGVTLDVDPLDPNNRILTITGNLGEGNSLTLPNDAFHAPGKSPFQFDEPTAAGGLVSEAVGESAHTETVVYDSLGTPVRLAVTIVLEGKSDAGNSWRFFVDSPDSGNGQRSVGMGTLLFDNSGRLLQQTGTSISIPRDATGSVTPLTMDLDFNGLIQGDMGSELVMRREDGAPVGTLVSFGIGEDGKIEGSFDNGARRTLGQVAVALFDNPAGLVDRGGNMFASGGNSGDPIVTTPQSLGAGKIKSSSLELSNVDLSEEFINMIIATTGFSAASRVITTSDQLIQELLNTSR